MITHSIWDERENWFCSWYDSPNDLNIILKCVFATPFALAFDILFSPFEIIAYIIYKILN